MRAKGLRTYGLIAWSPEGERIAEASPPLTSASTPDDEANWIEAELDELVSRAPEALVEMSMVESKWRPETLLRIAAAHGIPVAGDWAVPLVPVTSALTVIDALEAEGHPLWAIEVFLVWPDGGIQPDGWPIDNPDDGTSFDAARAVLSDLERDRWVFLDLAVPEE
jgi:hypothetical protein